METFRCPTCLFVLTGPEQSRCPSCHKRLRRRGGPIVLGGRKKSAAPERPDVDLVYAERAERTEVSEFTEVSESTGPPAEPVAPSRLIAPRVAAYEVPPAVFTPPVETAVVDNVADLVPIVEEAPEDLAPVVPLPFMTEAAAVQHTTIFAPSQFDPEMRQVLDDLYRKARAEVDDEYEHDGRRNKADDASA